MNLKDIIDVYVENEKNRMKSYIARLYSEYNYIPSLVIIDTNDIISEDSPSKRYISSKIKLANELGIICNLIQYSSNARCKSDNDIYNDLSNIIESACEYADGVIVQSPMLIGLDSYTEQSILNKICRKCNVDGFDQYGEAGSKLVQGYSPCTPMGIINFMKYYFNGSLAEHHSKLSGKNIVLLGRGKTVGKPLIEMLLHENCSLSVFHSKSCASDIRYALANADVVISAVGCPNLFDVNDVKLGCLVIDAGISIIDEKQVGDFSHDPCPDDLVDYTPWIGGVGRLTTISLMKNVLNSAAFSCNFDDIIS